MSLSDYYKPLVRKTVTRTPDGAGSYTESESSSNFQGYISYMNSFETAVSAQKKVFAVARLFTKQDLNVTDRVVDGDSNEFEVVGKYNFFHLFYELKKVN